MKDMEKELREKLFKLGSESENAFDLAEKAYQLGEKSLSEKNAILKHDADIMFNALWLIVSDHDVDNFDKCMDVACKALLFLKDKTRNDT